MLQSEEGVAISIGDDICSPTKLRSKTATRKQTSGYRPLTFKHAVDNNKQALL